MESSKVIISSVSLLLVLFALLLTLLGEWVPGIILLLIAFFLPAVWSGEVTSKDKGKLLGYGFAAIIFVSLYIYGDVALVILILFL